MLRKDSEARKNGMEADGPQFGMERLGETNDREREKRIAGKPSQNER